jgi:hypothetical protein
VVSKLKNGSVKFSSLLQLDDPSNIAFRNAPSAFGERTAHSFAAQGVFYSTDRVLDLACRLVGLAFGLQLRVARHLADRLLDGALALLAEPLIRSLSMEPSS